MSLIVVLYFIFYEDVGDATTRYAFTFIPLTTLQVVSTTDSEKSKIRHPRLTMQFSLLHSRPTRLKNHRAMKGSFNYLMGLIDSFVHSLLCIFSIEVVRHVWYSINNYKSIPVSTITKASIQP